ncbi:hypothetical protein GOARA_027_00200 [Gordonia araii NBRC 100433]|uniref:Uncharacterized protein n=1 Tax=Gordonia araii NBRC 100433 TaxID=1073574 RepID=G7GZN2_9ACTN|nr:hypothetical protein [Gordonia araii]NNG98880.1 hypothetical protein [Gordonia araii NBRC 100433]GAB09057.1 hypothetical protein GOARA_027_00200 [Gordonia araii NBRC 100433]
MLRLAILFTIASAAFSFMSFNRGGVIPGVVFAICAILPLAVVIVSTIRSKRSGGQPAPISPLGKGIMGAVSIVLVAALAYSVYWTFWSTKPADDLDNSYDLARVCDKTYFPQSAAYTGAGPHPIMVFTRSGTTSGLKQVDTPYDSPPEWRFQDEKQYQLVACLDDVSSGDKVGECEFDKGTVPVYQGKYKGRVIEPRTGKKVADVEVDGNRTKDCPTITMVYGDAKDSRIHTQPDFADLKRVLGTYVNG